MKTKDDLMLEEAYSKIISKQNEIVSPTEIVSDTTTETPVIAEAVDYVVE